jgi:hypothetical protein
VSKSPFVTKETKRLALSEDRWIEVKLRLSFGEEQRIQNAYLGRMRGMDNAAEAEMGVDFERGQVERFFVWLTDWSFCDENDKSVAVSRDAIRALDPDVVAEMEAALDAHVEAINAGKAPPNGRPKPAVRSR